MNPHVPSTKFKNSPFLEKLNWNVYITYLIEKGSHCEDTSQWIVGVEERAPRSWNKALPGPGQVDQLVRASFLYVKVLGSIPPSGHVQETINECINKWKRKLMFLFLLSSLSGRKETFAPKKDRTHNSSQSLPPHNGDPY